MKSDSYLLRQNKFLRPKQTVYQQSNGPGPSQLANANATIVPLGQHALHRLSLTNKFATADVPKIHQSPVQLVRFGTLSPVHVCAHFKPARTLYTRTTKCSANVDVQMDFQQQAVYQAKPGSLIYANVPYLLGHAPPFPTQVVASMGNIGTLRICSNVIANVAFKNHKSLHFARDHFKLVANSSTQPHVSAKHACMVLKTAQVSWTGTPIVAAAVRNRPTKAVCLEQEASFTCLILLTALSASVKLASAHQAKNLMQLSATVFEQSCLIKP
jgi:hypothetical protein